MNSVSTIVISEVTKYSDEVITSIQKLVEQLDDDYQPLTKHDLQAIISSQNTYLFVARHSRTKEIIGMITLVIYRIPYKRKAILEDIVVDKSYRRQGIGEKLIHFALQKAEEFGALTVDLTSRPTRTEANNLYKRFGFEKRETNSYRYTIS